MRVLQVYEIKYFARWFVLRVLAVPKYSQYAQQYLEYKVYFGRPCTVSTILRPILQLKSLTDGPTSGSWSKLLISLGTTRILRALTGSISGVCTARSMYCEYTLSISMFCLFYPELEETFILREHILYVLDFTLPVITYHGATSISRNFFYLRLRRKHWRRSVQDQNPHTRILKLLQQ